MVGAPDGDHLVVSFVSTATPRVVTGGCRARTQRARVWLCHASERGRRQAPPAAARMSSYLRKRPLSPICGVNPLHLPLRGLHSALAAGSVRTSTWNVPPRG